MFSLRMAVVALVLFFLPTILVVVTHAVALQQGRPPPAANAPALYAFARPPSRPPHNAC